MISGAVLNVAEEWTYLISKEWTKTLCSALFIPDEVRVDRYEQITPSLNTVLIPHYHNAASSFLKKEVFC